MNASLNLGRLGEEIASKYLLNLGYEILDQNWVFDKAEIDIIALFDNKIVFVEVKSRRSQSFGLPDSFVDENKIMNLSRAADHYLYLVDFNGEVRFDIISILFNENQSYTLNHIDDAFWPE